MRWKKTENRNYGEDCKRMIGMNRDKPINPAHVPRRTWASGDVSRDSKRGGYRIDYCFDPNRDAWFHRLERREKRRFEPFLGTFICSSFVLGRFDSLAEAKAAAEQDKAEAA